MPQPDAALVAGIRPFVPLIRALRAAGFTHVSYGSVYYGGVDHSWQRRDGDRTATSIDLDSDGFTLEHIAPLEADEYKVRIKGRLSPEQVRMILATYGIVSLDVRAFRLAFSDPGAYVERERDEADPWNALEPLTHWQLRALQAVLCPTTREGIPA